MSVREHRKILDGIFEDEREDWAEALRDKEAQLAEFDNNRR